MLQDARAPLSETPGILVILCEAKPISDGVRQERQILARMNLFALLVASSSENDAICCLDTIESS